MVQINEPNEKTASVNKLLLFNLGFRIFFLAAGIFSALSMLLWFAIYQFQLDIPFKTISSYQWHAHEMIYGYSIAVIAGFLLTATKNWTGIQTASGVKLILLFSLWLGARLSYVFGEHFILLAASLDVIFLLLLTLAIAIPILKVRQWGQAPVLLVLLLVTLFNGIFFTGVLTSEQHEINTGLYGGFYLVISLILIMSRRVVPFFIERGVGENIQLFQSKIIDVLIIISLIVFFLSEVGLNNDFYAAIAASMLFLLSAVRLTGWHHKGIWKKSMLWGLYLANAALSLGFLLLVIHYVTGIVHYYAVHLFAVGGIGLITLSMMSRVALGHTGRDATKPHKSIRYALLILLVSVVFRVVMPFIDTENYSIWIGIAQLCWIISFTIFSLVYLPILTKPRIDNMPG